MPKKYELVEKIKNLRDELKLHSHLFKMESKEEWEKLEKKWQALDPRLREAKKAIMKAEAHVEAATGFILEELWDGYDRLKKSLRKL